MSPDEPLEQQTYTTIMKHLIRTGRAPHYTELAHLLEVGIDEARRLQFEAAKLGIGCWFAQDTDYVESWAPFSSLPTHYWVTVAGQQKWYGQ